MKVRLLADADLNKVNVNGVLRREPSIDFLTADTAGLQLMKDPEVLALAAEQQRVLVKNTGGMGFRHGIGHLHEYFNTCRGRRAFAWITESSVLPSMYSMTMKSEPSSQFTS